MDGKKIAFVVVLIVAIVAAFILMAKRMDIVGGGPQPPERIMNQPLTLIDMKKPEVVLTKTLREWQKLGQDSAGRYKNPDTKDFTMAYPIICVSCQKQIPPPDYPVPSQTGDPAAFEAQKLALDKAYKCPSCGKSPFPPEQLNREVPPPAK